MSLWRKKQLTTVNTRLTEKQTPEARPLGYKPTAMPSTRRSCKARLIPVQRLKQSYFGT